MHALLSCIQYIVNYRLRLVMCQTGESELLTVGGLFVTALVLCQSVALL